jgi:hypothetical protein
MHPQALRAALEITILYMYIRFGKKSQGMNSATSSMFQFTLTRVLVQVAGCELQRHRPRLTKKPCSYSGRAPMPERHRGPIGQVSQ